jgi:hypothetical protein
MHLYLNLQLKTVPKYVTSRLVNAKYLHQLFFHLSSGKNLVLIPDGDLVLLPGDLVAAITTPESEKKLERLFY